MPTITAEGPPKNDMDKKRAFVAALTQAAAEYYALAPSVITVILKENPPENVAVGGQLLVDRRKPPK